MRSGIVLGAMDRRTLAVGLVASAGAFALVFFAFTLFCGMMAVEGNEPGEPPNEPYCVPAPHPVAAGFAMVCVLGVWLAWRRMAWAVVGLGALMTATFLLFIFSMGYFGLGPAIAVVVAGLLLLGTGDETEPGPAASM